MKRINNRIIFSLLLVILAISLISKKEITVPEPLYKLPYFSYPNQHSAMFTANSLSDKISVIDFFFTSCEGPCPAMNRYMKYLAERFSNNKNIQFVSFSVDPLIDSKEKIKSYLNTSELNYDNWHFLETDTTSIRKLLENGFKLSGEGLPGMHSTKFILVDSNSFILGYYNPFVKKELDNLEDHISYLLDNI